jgi:release factor glutamine methyltransferase
VTPRDLLAAAVAELAAAGVASPDYDAAELLAHVLGVPRLAVRSAADASEEQVAEFEELVRRRAAGSLRKPPPRSLRRGRRGPESSCPARDQCWPAGRGPAREVLAAGRTPVVVDLCTGSGAMALALATEVPEAQVHAVELDENAHAWAVRNLSGSGVDLRQGDMAAAFPDLDGTVDVVVCNPPYIPLEAFESVAAEARDHDPALALWSGEDGLDAIRVLERVAARLLGRRLGGRRGADVQGESAPAVFAAAGRWCDVRDNPDLAGRARFVTARLAR